MAIFGPGGKVRGVMSFRGQLLFVFTNIEAGPGRAWTIRTLSVSEDEGEDLRALIFQGINRHERFHLFGGPSIRPPLVSQKWGFIVVRHQKDAFGISSRWCNALAVPHWLLMPLAFWPITTWILRRNRQRLRRKRGNCLTCGYDLREAKDRCPECGAEIAKNSPPLAASQAQNAS
jgi:hypothetical protein